MRSHLGTFALTTVGAINNAEALVEAYFSGGGKQFMAMSSGDVNTTELVAALINQQEDFVSGIKFAQDAIEGSLTLLVMTQRRAASSRRATRWAACPCSSARATDGYCVSFESFAYHKLGYRDDAYELGPGEIVRVNPDEYRDSLPCRRAR